MFLSPFLLLVESLTSKLAYLFVSNKMTNSREFRVLAHYAEILIDF